MSDAPSTTDRPQQATMGAWMVVGAAALHVLGSFDNMSNLRSIETKERVDEALEAAEGGLGVSQEQMLQLMHGGLLVSAAAATAAIFLGVMAFRRDRIAPRVLIGLSVLMLLGSLMFDPLWAMFVAAGTALLWSGPARDWFAGREVRPSRFELAMKESRDKSVEGGPADRPSSDGARPWPPTTSAPPPPVTPPPAQDQPEPHAPSYGQPQPEPHASPYGQPQQPNPYAPPPPVHGLGAVPTSLAQGHRPGQRASAPTGVKAAGWVTLVASSLALVGMAFTLFALFAARSQVIAEIERAIRTEPRLDQLPAGFGADEIAAATAVVVVVMLIWSVVAMALAILVMRGHNWARIVLVISAAVTALICLLGMPATLVHALAAVVVVILLVTPEANKYFREGGPAMNSSGHSSGHQPFPGPPPPTFTQPPPREQDPKRDEDGKPPVW